MALKKLKMETVFNKCIFTLRDHDDVTLRFAMIGDGNKLPVLIDDDKVCRILNKKQFMQIAKNLVRDEYEEYKDACGNPEVFLLTGSSAGQLFDTCEISSALQLNEDVKPFAFKSDPSYTFCRIPFDPNPSAVMPVEWATFLENFTNVRAVCMWIGSLFFEKSDRSQYLWIYGQGGNGKSTLARVISEILGQFVRYEQAPSKDDKYWTNGLIGKRLIVLDDCNQYGFVKTGLFKSLTGSSKVRVEAKYGAPYDADLDCKFLFTSNELPLVSDEVADMRRLILSTSKNTKLFEFNKDFELSLKRSLPDFISCCMTLFQFQCEDGRPIPVDKEEALELANSFDEEIESWLESVGEFCDNGLCHIYEFNKALRQTNFNKRNVGKFLNKMGVRKDVRTIAGKACRVLVGFKMKVHYGNF